MSREKLDYILDKYYSEYKSLTDTEKECGSIFRYIEIQLSISKKYFKRFNKLSCNFIQIFFNIQSMYIEKNVISTPPVK